MRVLLIKMSSLGDVVHALTGLTDARRNISGIVFDWVVEEAYREIPHWHPAVRRTIASPFRRWRKEPVRMVSKAEWWQFLREVRRDRYDLVLDAQGLIKSAFAGKCARAPLAGRSFRSAREPAASLLYDRRFPVNKELPEVEQLRQLFARALNYPEPSSPAEFGLGKESIFAREGPGKYVVFLHGAAWPSKLWDERNWTALGQMIRPRGIDVLLPWGSELERQRAERLSRSFGGRVLERLSISKLASMLAGAQFIVGLDTGLTHLGIALGARTVTLYGPSVPVYKELGGAELINLCSSSSRAVDTNRPNTVPVAEVIQAIQRWL